MVALTEQADAPVRRGDGPGGRFPRFPALAAGLLAAAWLIPAALQLVDADWLLPPLLLFGTASLLRVGTVLLDRLMIAGGLLGGAVIGAGLLFSAWPWHLSPMAVGWFGLTVLVVVGLVLRRRPQLPRRVLGTDLIILAAPVVSWVLIRKPVQGQTFSNMLPYTSARQDFFNHYALYDAIHRIGGYTFMHPAAARHYVTTPNEYAYPSGAHFLYAVLDAFRTSSSNPGDSVDEFLRYYQYEALGVGLLAMAVIWSARWVAGPALTGWRRALVCSVVGGMAVLGQMSALFWQGYDGEVIGLAFLAMLFALVVQPPARVREQILLAAALIVGVVYSYSLYFIFIGVIVFCAAVVYRKRLLRHWRFALVTAIVAIPVAAVPYVMAQLHSYGTQGLFTQGGTTLRFSRALSLFFGVVAVAPLATRAGRRLPRWRVVAPVILISTAISTYTGYIGYQATGMTRYYYEKMVEGTWTMSLVAFGAVGLFLKSALAAPAGASRLDVSRRRHWLTTEIPASVAAFVLGVTVSSGFPLTKGPQWSQGPRPIQDVSWAALWAGGPITAPYAHALAMYGQHYQFGDGQATALLYSDSAADEMHATMFLAVLNHDLGKMGFLGLDGSDNLVSLQPPAKGQGLPDAAKSALGQLESWLSAHDPGFRVVIGDNYLARLLTDWSAQNPDMRMKIEIVKGLS